MNELEVRQQPMELSVPDLLAQVQKIQQVMKSCMQENEHYGKIPGTNKPTLLKAGAEKLNLLFRFDPQYDSVEHYDGDHLTVKSKCTLFHITTGARVGSGEGSCSTKETKYAYRNAALSCPDCGKETIIKGRVEYGGGWLCFGKKGGCGSKFPDEQFDGVEVGKIPNDALPDQYNTVLKMANKRSLIAAVLNATAASDIFTQDLEDMVANGQKFGAEQPAKETEKPKREQPISFKTVLWDNLLKHAGKSKKAGDLLHQLSGKRFISNLSEAEAKDIQVKFEIEILGSGLDDEKRETF